jgi:hypothetical protein
MCVAPGAGIWDPSRCDGAVCASQVQHVHERHPIVREYGPFVHALRADASGAGRAASHHIHQPRVLRRVSNGRGPRDVDVLRCAAGKNAFFVAVFS